MSNLSSLFVMSGFLGLGAFGVALLPLSFSFSKPRINQISNFGTGLLIGAALGVILPEGIESVVELSKSSGKPTSSITSSIALSLIFGFAFMLLVEQLTSHSHPHSQRRNSFALSPSSAVTVDPELEFDFNLGPSEGRASRAVFPLTFGLVVHSLADGFALGAAALPTASSSQAHGATEISLVVFFALLIHKAPAALALTSSLLASSLPRNEIRKHAAAFAISTPLGAVATYFLLELLGSGSTGDWTGVALLFSAGTFLYVATVLQPISSHSTDESDKVTRLGMIIVGMMIPYLIGLLVGHEHEGMDSRLPGGVRIGR